MLAADRLAEAGAEVGRVIQARIGAAKRGNRRSGGVSRKSVDWHPTTADELVYRSGLAKLEFIVGSRVRDDAVRYEREYWMPRLERWHAAEAAEPVRWMLAREIKRLRRALGIAPSLEHKRALTRARVAKWRKRRQPAALTWNDNRHDPNAYEAQFDNVTYHIIPRYGGFVTFLFVRGARGGTKRLNLGHYKKCETGLRAALRRRLRCQWREAAVR